MNNKKIDSLFYTNIENYEPVESFFNDLENYAKQGINPVYIVNRPLGEKKYKYNYEKAFVLLIPKHKLIFINYGNNQEAFNDFVEDMIDDIGHLSDRYEYMKVLGRPRQWRKTFTAFYNYCDIEQIPLQDFLKANRLHSREEERKGEFLISLLTGSINDIERTGIDYPDTLLEKIKKKLSCLTAIKPDLFLTSRIKIKLLSRDWQVQGKQNFCFIKYENCMSEKGT